MERVAVIGAGVAGLTAAYLLRTRYEVMLFEAEPRLGGHAHTHEVPAPDGATVRLDTGFLVHNTRTYPTLTTLLTELGVATQDAEMSMSVRCDGCGLEYAGSRGLSGLLPTAATLARPRYLRMLAEVPRFHRQARRVLADGPDDLTLGQFLTGFSEYFTSHFALPLVSAVWSCGERVSRGYPARYLFTFLANHGLLSVTDSPTWRTVVGGSRSYVERIAKGLSATNVSTPVRALHRHTDGVTIRDDADEAHRADRVVVATHPDQALALLAEPTDAERRALGAFRYSRNETVLHTDAAVLPHAANARASWNYLRRDCRAEGEVTVHYHLNRLMRLSEPVDYVVSLNTPVDERDVIARMAYAHPVYTRESVAAQRLLPGLNTGRTAFAGAYHGWGFHEDGCVAGVAAAASLGAGWP